MTNQAKAYAFGLATVLMWSTVATAFKLSLAVMEPVQLLFYACLASTLVLAAICAARGRLGLLLACTPRQYLFSALMGAMNPFLYYLVLFGAYDLLPAQEAQPINYTWAVALALLSVPLLGHRLTARDLASTAVSYFGVVVIATRGEVASLSFASPLGVGLALFSTVVWALYWILSTRDDRDPVAGLLLNFLFALPLVATATWLTHGFAVDPKGLLGAAYVGTFEMGVTFVTWLSALKLTTSASKVGNLIFISPFLSLVFIHYLLGEAILPSTYLGLALIVAGLAWQQLAKAPKPPSEAA